jgi:hypothetical protein
MTTRELAARITRVKAIPVADGRQRDSHLDCGAAPQHISYGHLRALIFANNARQGTRKRNEEGKIAVIENRVTSDGPKLIEGQAASLGGPAGPPEPERDDANEYAAYWRERSGFFPAVPGIDRNRYRAGDE